jgi:hypothetical protein
VALYPGWDSLDSVRTWHTVFEISGIAFLALLVGAEILAFQYGHRKDELMAIAEAAAETKRMGDADAAEARRKTDVEALQKRLAEADKKVAGLQSQNVARRLSDSDKQALIRDLSNSPGQKAKIFCITSAWDCVDYATDFQSVFREAKWVVPNEIVYGMIMGHDVVGVEILANSAVAKEPRKVPGDFADSINYLVKFLTKNGQMETPTVVMDDTVTYGELILRIGRIPTASVK